MASTIPAGNLLLGAMLLLASCAGAPAPAAPSSTDKAGPPFLPGVAADAERRRAFANDPAGRLMALDLATGQAPWKRETAARPLLATRERLFALAPVDGAPNRLRVLMLAAARQGQTLLESQVLTLPDWVSIQPSPGKTFRAEARLEEGSLVLEWRAQSVYAGGARPTPEILEQSNREASGAARIDLKTGNVETLPSFPGATGDPAGPASIPGDTQCIHLWTGDVSEEKPFLVRNRWVCLGRSATPSGDEIRLRTWDAATGRPVDPVPLAKGGSIEPLLSPDRETLFLRIPAAASGSGVEAWQMIDLPSGERLATLPYQPGTTAATASGSAAFFLVEARPTHPSAIATTVSRELTSVSLKPGRRLWTVAIQGETEVLPPP